MIIGIIDYKQVDGYTLPFHLINKYHCFGQSFDQTMTIDKITINPVIDESNSWCLPETLDHPSAFHIHLLQTYSYEIVDNFFLSLVFIADVSLSLRGQCDLCHPRYDGSQAYRSCSHGGRITDIDGVPSKQRTIYISTAGGGIWKNCEWRSFISYPFSTNILKVHRFLAIDPNNPNILLLCWYGESNMRNSVSIGFGMYKSTDAGKTGQNRPGQYGAHQQSDHSSHQFKYHLCSSSGHLWNDRSKTGACINLLIPVRPGKKYYT